MSYSKLGMKSQIALKIRCKITWTYLSYGIEVKTIRGRFRNRGKVVLYFENIGVIHKIKNRGKTIILIQNRGMNARAPYLYP